MNVKQDYKCFSYKFLLIYRKKTETKKICSLKLFIQDENINKFLSFTNIFK